MLEDPQVRAAATLPYQWFIPGYSAMFSTEADARAAMKLAYAVRKVTLDEAVAAIEEVVRYA